MSWIFLDGIKFAAAEMLYEMEFSGSDMWVTSSNTSVKVYSFWGEGEGLQTEIDLSSYLDDTKHIIKVFDEMYVFDDAVSEFVCINMSTKSVIGTTLTITNSTNCIPIYGDFKIWFVTDKINDSQKLYYYDIVNQSWSTPVTIPGRHQESKRKMVWSKGDFVFVTMVNESGVAKFNASTGAYVSQILTNRMPADNHDLIVNDARDILVAGFTGMVSSVDQITDTPSNISGLNAVSESFIDDGTYLWTVKPSLARITKGSVIDNYLVMQNVPTVVTETHQNVFYNFGFALNNEDVTSLTSVKQGSTTLVEDSDYTFEVDDTFAEQRLKILTGAPNITGNAPFTITVGYDYDPSLEDFKIIGFSDTVFNQVLTTPEYTHEYWDGSSIQSKTEPMRIVVLADNAIYFAYNLTDSWTLNDTREYLLTVKGTALVGTGPEAYHGETE